MTRSAIHEIRTIILVLEIEFLNEIDGDGPINSVNDGYETPNLRHSSPEKLEALRSLSPL